MFYTPALFSVYCSHLFWLLLGIALQAWRDLSSEPEKQLLHYALTVIFYSNKAPILAESSKQQCLAASPDYPPKFSVVPKAPIQCPPWSSQVLNILCAWMHEEKGRKKEGKQSVKKQWLSLVWAERECWSRRETSNISQAGGFRKYSCRRLTVVMTIEQSSRKTQQTGKTEALCRAENIVSRQHSYEDCWNKATLLSHSLTQAESAETNGLEWASHLRLYLRSFCCLSIYKLWPSSSKEQTIRPAVACQSSWDIWQSFRRVKILDIVISCSSPLETVWPQGPDCKPTPLILIKNTLKPGEQDQQARSSLDLILRSLNFLQFPLLSSKTEKGRENMKQKNETALARAATLWTAYAISLIYVPHSFP